MGDIHIRGTIPRKVIRYWLDNYEALMMNDRPIDAVPTNSGPKPDDGIPSGLLNKIMLDEALRDMPKLNRVCVQARWIYRLPLGKTLRGLKIEKDRYYRICDQSVELIYLHVNRGTIGIQKFAKKIEETP